MSAGTFNVTRFVEQHLSWLGAIGLVLVSVLTGLVVRRVVLRRLGALAAATDWQFDDVLVSSLRRPLPLWFGLAGVYGASRLLAPPVAWASPLDKLLIAALVVSGSRWLADLLVQAVPMSGAHADGHSPVTGVVKIAVRIAVVAVGALVLLSTFGISITPLLTTVGIGGLAVALGLQETLASLFAGINITLAGNIRVGDFVRLETGEEGYVEDIRWRATRIRTLPNNVVLIPNGRLAQSVVTNYHLPVSEIAVPVEFGVHYASDLEQVERVTKEVGRSVLKSTAGAVTEFEPAVRFRAFGASSIDLVLVLRAREYSDTFLLKHECIKTLARRFAEEGIVIPFPITAVNLEQENAGQRLGETPSVQAVRGKAG